MLGRVLLIVFPLFAVVAVGFLYGRPHRPDMTAATKLNMDLLVPALIFGALSLQGRRPGCLWRAGRRRGAAGDRVRADWLAGVELRTFLRPMRFVSSGNMGIPLLM